MFFVILFFVSFSINAGEITPQVIYDSINHYHPTLAENLLNIEEAEGRVVGNKGNFDTKLQSEYMHRSGQYGNNYSLTQLSKPISQINSSIYGGYKKGTGNFPVYDGSNITGDSGRLILGGEVNLFKNSKIYKDSITLTNSKMDVKQMETLYKLVKIDLLEKALDKYWDWAFKGMKLKTLRTLLEFAEERQKAIELRVSHGDMAKFYAIENQQYILQRKNKVQQTLNDFIIASYELSLYFRDSNGKMINITEKNLPEQMPDITKNLVFENDYRKAIAINPSIQFLNIETEKLKNELIIAKAETRPDVKLKSEYYKDIKHYNDPTLKIGFNFEIPLERRKGKGKIIEIENKQKQIVQKKIFLENKIFVELQSITNTIENYHQIWQNAAREFEIATKLVEMERENVKQGNSEFFTLNLREQAQFDAKVRALEFHANLNKAYIAYGAILMEIDVLLNKSPL